MILNHDFTVQDIAMRSFMGYFFGLLSVIKAYSALSIKLLLKPSLFVTFKISIPWCILVTFLIIITLKGEKNIQPSVALFFPSLEVALEKIMIYLRRC